METTISFGYWIRRQRKALDLTQQMLAERVGCSLAAIKKIEADVRRPSRQIAERLADVLGIPVSQRDIFLESARGLRSVDQLLLAHEPEISTEIPSLPSGTVTFLFTDIESSTRLAQQYRATWEALRKRHHAILRVAIKSNNGYVFQIVGDAFCAAFHTPTDSLHAAIDAQRKLQTENWGKSPIKVRMGIHTGEAELQDNEYHGYLTLSLAQRLMSTGHGGQIVISQATESLLHGQLPEDVSLQELGEYNLKDIAHPVHIFQVVVPDLQKEFPTLRALDIFPNNLPVQLTSFIGREKELADTKNILHETHLLTLTGSGGTGKTRLALQLATELLEAKDFIDGVWFIELAPLADPTLVPQTIAAALGIREQPGRTILDALTDYVRAKTMLLILDNCEHLIENSAQLANGLLRAAPHLKILATSRESLSIAGETVYRVPSLPLPDLQQLHELDSFAQNDCIHLFIDRAQAAYPRFILKDKNAPAVADICHRLDGIPLAIELAAARTKVFSPEDIAARLDDRFRLLTSGSRTALERHQTLFALIEWSHNLLSEAERVFLRRLSVFAGGWSFRAAEAVCRQGIDEETLDLLTHLVDKSLVIAEEQEGEVRYHFLETIRQYARDRLFESGEAEQVRDRHVLFFIQFAEAAEPKLRSAEQIEWLERVEIEHDNLRAALAWSLESGRSDRAMRLGGAAYWFWSIRGYWSEGQRWLDEAISLDERVAGDKKYLLSRVETAQRAKALYGAAILRFSALGLSETVRSKLEESLRLWRMLEDKWWMALALKDLGQVNYTAGDISAAKAQCEEGVGLARQIEDKWVLAAALSRLGRVLHDIDVRAAQPITEEAVTLARKVGDKSVLSYALVNLVVIYFFEGNYRVLMPLAEEALLTARAIGSKTNVVYSLTAVGVAALLQGNLEQAIDNLMHLLAFTREMGSSVATAYPLLGFGILAVVSGQPRRAVQLFGAIESLLRRFGIEVNSWSGGTGAIYRKFLQSARAQLNSATFNTAMAEGRALTLEQAIVLAIEDKSEDSQLSQA